MKLYKYMESKFAKLLTERGVLRIGTQNDFRKSEHLSGISDSTEGKKITKVDIKYKNYAHGGLIPKSLDLLKLISADKSSTNIHLENIHISTEQVAPDCFIWCSSSVCSNGTMKEFAGADTCVEIHNTNIFFLQLSKTLKVHRCHFEGVFEVKYGKKLSLGILLNSAFTRHCSKIQNLQNSMNKEAYGVPCTICQ